MVNDTGRTVESQTLDLFEVDVESDAGAHATSQELMLTQSKLGDLLDLMPAGLLIHQEQGIVYANQEAERILGCNATQLVGRHLFDFVDDAQLDAVRTSFVRCLTAHESTRALDCQLIVGGGNRTFVQISMSALPWEGLPVMYVLINDVDALKTTEAVLRRLSVTDSLTGAYNRRYFMDEAQRELDRSRRYGRPLSLLLLDLDHFKRINDVHGHLTGDEALRRFTAVCQRLLRGPDVLGRIGGEEFAVLLPETDIDGAVALAERLRAAVAEIQLTSERGPVPVTVSVGIAAAPGPGSRVDHLLSIADKALYRAKQRGRNRVERCLISDAA